MTQKNVDFSSVSDRPRARCALPLVLAVICCLGFVERAIAAAELPTERIGAANLIQEVEGLSVLARALYVAAHPDDENTAVLAWLARGYLADTTYLSLTRGDGGQNLIGTERGSHLGLIRAQELLAAREIDGADQLFSSAIDFGYTKSVTETLERWGRTSLLDEVVQVFRTFQPDVVITRFPGDGRGGHGQHTAATVLTRSAFAAAADPEYPGMTALDPWPATRVVWNVFGLDSQDSDQSTRHQLIEVDVGSWSPVLGESYLELSARSRSQHKSQGFGASPRAGSSITQFQVLEGKPATDDLFEGIDTTWGRVDGSAEVRSLVEHIQTTFDPTKPRRSLELLLDLKRELTRLAGISKSPWPQRKLEDVDQLIAAVIGLSLDATAPHSRVIAGQSLRLSVRAIVREDVDLVLDSIRVGDTIREPKRQLEPNRSAEFDIELPIEPTALSTRPAWLQQVPRPDRYRYELFEDVARANGPARFVAQISVSIEELDFVWHQPVLHRWTDPVLGARSERVVVSPPVIVELDDSVVLFGDGKSRAVSVIVSARTDDVAGELVPSVPEGWKAEPRSRAFDLDSDGDERALEFTITPPATASTGDLLFEIKTQNGTFSKTEVRIDYPHLPPQTDFPPASSRLVSDSFGFVGEKIGYVMGAGDQIPQALEQIGLRVDLLSDEAVASTELDRFDAIVLGIRAFNTRDRVASSRHRLFEYVARGGTLVVQYNTAHALKTDEIGPFPIELSRGRITREEVMPTFLDPQHPLLERPNRITSLDFQDWVQERGLYFAGAWDERYLPLFSWADPGEANLEGGLLIAHHGSGVYVYTGISFFRQVPAGVPGALRLFLNLISARQEISRP